MSTNAIKIADLSKALDTVKEIENLTAIFNHAIKLLTEDKAEADRFYEELMNAYEEVRGFSTVSEDGIIEKAINECLKNKNEMGKRLEKIQDNITRIITTKLTLEANIEMNKLGANTLNKPINISDFKN